MDSLTYSSVKGPLVSNMMFGVKLPRDYGADNVEAYADALVDVGAQTVRFAYDVDLGEFTFGDDDISIYQSVDFASKHGYPVVMVILAKNLFLPDTDGDFLTPRSLDLAKIATVKHFVKDLLAARGPTDEEFPNAVIDAIELGNEYWGLGEMTSREYGKLVNTLARVVQEAIDELGTLKDCDPKILVQMGSPFSREFEDADSTSPYMGYGWASRVWRSNVDILAQLTSPAARDAIDGLVDHFYFTGTSNVFDSSSAENRFLDRDFQIWSEQGFSDRARYITEWNTKLNNPSQFGLKGTGVVVEMMEIMLRMGVDVANIWPLQHNHTRLIKNLIHDEVGEHILTPRGAVFELMSHNLPGTHLLDSNLTTLAGHKYELNAFAGGDRYVFYVSSRSEKGQSVNLNLSDVVTTFETIDAVKIGYDPKTTDGFYQDDGRQVTVPRYQDPDALANLTAIDTVVSPRNISFTLGAYEVVQLVFHVAPGVKLTGKATPDVLKGGDGHDTILGYGADDKIIGGSGNDFLKGYGGKDNVFGSSGHDTLGGGSGSDRLDGGNGVDVLTGGTGRDVFIFSRPPGRMNVDQISDFIPKDDVIHLNHRYFTKAGLGYLDQQEFSSNLTGMAQDKSDRVIFEKDTGNLYYDRDGTGVAARQLFATLDTDLRLTAGDFFIF